MAEGSPPPLPDEEEVAASDSPMEQEQEDFLEPNAPEAEEEQLPEGGAPASVPPPEEEKSKEDEVKEKPLENVELSEPDDSAAPTLETREADETEPTATVSDPTPPTLPAAAPAKVLDLFEEEEEEHDDHTPLPGKGKDSDDEKEDEGFEMEISVSEPEKVGDGLSSYLTYLVRTKTTNPSFQSPEVFVRRRFSDFLGLYQRLLEKYGHKGIIVPPAPEKTVLGMTKMKLSKSEESGAGFIERRRASLERYLMRIAKHPVLRKDADFKDFLENASELPKAKDTSAISGAGFLRLVKNVGESIAKIAGKKTEGDDWFEEKQLQYEALDAHLKKLSQSIEVMVLCRKELCLNTSSFVKSVAVLGNVEENNSVSRALSRLSEVQEKVESLHQGQLQCDVFLFGETVKDHIALLTAIKGCFVLRTKTYSTWQNAQVTLAKKKDTEQKLRSGGGKAEKLAQIEQEIREWEEKQKDGQKAFEDNSKTLKSEIEKYEQERAQEFKMKFIKYLETMMEMQQELIRLWEDYQPDTQAITVE